MVHSRLKTYLIATTLGLSLISVAPASAKSRGFDTTIETQVSTPVKLEILMSEDMQHRANNLPKKLSDRGSSHRLNAGFSANGYYGDSEIKLLAERLEKKMAERLEKRGVEVSDTAPTVLRLTIVEARPNRPTFEQLSRDTGLSLQSFGVGGAEVEGELVAAGGQSLGTLHYKYYDNDIHNAQYNATWSDAYRAFDRAARHTAKTLAE